MHLHLILHLLHLHCNFSLNIFLSWSGLSEFTDLLHKLQTVIEEELSTASAVRRVLNIVKNTILKSKDNSIRRMSVENVVENLKDQVKIILYIYMYTALTIGTLKVNC